ncbi:MAG: hypothetical protein LUD14_09285 [Clostridiales bacterium]|nr:hypothetical protein [Clostridiales bacterium]
MIRFCTGQVSRRRAADGSNTVGILRPSAALFLLPGIASVMKEEADAAALGTVHGEISVSFGF